MAKMLYTLKWVGTKPTVSDLVEKYDIELEDLDDNFGIVTIDPRDNLYAILAEEKAISQIQGKGRTAKRHRSIKGPYSNPSIAPFGPVS